LRRYDSRVIRCTRSHDIKTKMGKQTMVLKDYIVPLDFNHPFHEDEMVTVVRKDDLEWVLNSLQDLEKDKINLEKHIEILRDTKNLIPVKENFIQKVIKYFPR
jgi:hypothetical protein